MQVRGGEVHGDALHAPRLRLRLLRSILLNLQVGLLIDGSVPNCQGC